MPPQTISTSSPPGALEMRLELSAEQKVARRTFRAFVDEHVAPYAAAWDRDARIPRSIVDTLRDRAYLGAPLDPAFGGGGMPAITYGLLTAELARGCSSVRSLLTVHDMVGVALTRWGSPRLKAEVLPRLANGQALGALALSEPEVGSDAAHVQTVAHREPGGYRLVGRKKWITFGQIADYFLTLAQCEGQPTAFLVPATATGFSRQPNEEVMGTRASLLAELAYDDLFLPDDHRLSREGFGFSHVITTALDHGRYSVAWGGVGIAEGCLEACQDYTSKRRQGGVFLREHQLVQQILTEMISDSRAARLLAYRAGWLRQNREPGAALETMVAKYFSSRVAVRVANDAVQLHGANGMTDSYPVARYLRDAKVLEIIEGSSQIQQITIPSFPLDEL